MYRSNTRDRKVFSRVPLDYTATLRHRIVELTTVKVNPSQTLCDIERQGVQFHRTLDLAQALVRPSGAHQIEGIVSARHGIVGAEFEGALVLFLGHPVVPIVVEKDPCVRSVRLPQSLVDLQRLLCRLPRFRYRLSGRHSIPVTQSKIRFRYTRQ